MNTNNLKILVIYDIEGGLKNQSVAAARSLSTNVIEESYYTFHKSKDNIQQLLKKDPPDIIISSGPVSSKESWEIHEAARAPIFNKQKKPLFIHFQTPAMDYTNHFDLVVSYKPVFPEIGYENKQFLIKYVPSLYSSDFLKESYEANKSRFDPNKKYCCVMIGGDSLSYNLGKEDANEFAKNLINYVKETGLVPIINTSKRTDFEFAKRLNGILLTQNIDFIGNPFPSEDNGSKKAEVEKSRSLMAAAMHISETLLPTSDSLSMMCESASTGKKVEVIKVKSATSPEKELLQYLCYNKFAIEFTGHKQDWQQNNERFDPNSNIADRILEAYLGKLEQHTKRR